MDKMNRNVHIRLCNLEGIRDCYVSIMFDSLITNNYQQKTD